MAINEIIMKVTCGCINVKTKKLAINTVSFGKGIIPKKTNLPKCMACNKKMVFVEYKGLEYDSVKKKVVEKTPEYDEKGEIKIDVG